MGSVKAGRSKFEPRYPAPELQPAQSCGIQTRASASGGCGVSGFFNGQSGCGGQALICLPSVIFFNDSTEEKIFLLMSPNHPCQRQGLNPADAVANGFALLGCEGWKHG